MTSPFAPEPVPEIPLTDSPLTGVLFQVRFKGQVAVLRKALASGDLQTGLSEAFPFAEEQESYDLVVAPGRPATTKPGAKQWALTSDDGQRVVNIGDESIALTVKDYRSRSDLVAQIAALLRVTQEVAGPPSISRVGVRYLNRVNESDNLGQWISGLAEGARGILAARDTHDSHIGLSMSHVVYEYSDMPFKLQARWGLLPANVVIDASMSPVENRSWILDADAFSEVDQKFDAEVISSTVGHLAARSYRFFRWVVTPACLERFGPREIV